MNTHLLDAVYRDRSHGIAGFYIASLIKYNQIHQAEFFRDSVNAWFGPGTRSEVLLMTSAQFAIDRYDHLNKLDVDNVNWYVMKMFRNWFVDKVRSSKRQARYQRTVENHCRDFHQKSYTTQEEVDKMITEKRLNKINYFMKTKGLQERFIFECIMGTKTREYNEAGKIINLPGRKEISRQGFYLKQRALKEELRAWLAEQEDE